jgi:hypothetical protein
MFISRFNRFFERHGRWAYFLLGLVISLSFVVFVTPGKLLGNREMFQRTVGTMYGETIERKDFLRKIQETDVAVLLQRGQLLSQDSARSDELISETLKRMRALREAKMRGLTAVSKAELADTIRGMWMFQVDGKFERDRFTQFEDNFLRTKGLDGTDFDRIVRENIAIGRLEEQVASDVFVSPTEVRDFYDQMNEQFEVKYVQFRADISEDGNPGDEEIQAYFDTHRDELRRPDEKRIRVAVFSSQDLMKDVEVTDEDIKEHFEKLSRSAYKGKKLDDVRKQIEITLKRTKATAKAREKANLVKEKVGALKEGETPAQLAERFAEVCKELGVEVKDSGPFVDDGAIPNVGQFPVFRRKAYELSAEKPLSDVIYDAGRYFLACWLETIPGKAPEELDEVMKKQVSEAILAQDAKRFYAAKVEAYRDDLEKAESAWDLTKVYDEKLAMQTDLSDEQKEKMRAEFRDDVRTFVVPNFVPEQKKILAVVFHPPAFRDQVTVTEDDIAAYYEQHQADYSKKEVRARQIMLRIPPDATDEQKADIKAKLDTILNEIREGASFEDMARFHSEDIGTKSKGGDMGFVEQGAKPAAVDEALFSMEPGEVSPVIETPSSYVLLKVEEIRDGRALQDVAGEIRETLIKERSESRAMDAAADFADKAFDAVERALAPADGVDEKPTKTSAAEAFNSVAKKAGLSVQESEFFRENGVIAPFGYNRDLSSEAFKLTAESPLSDPIKAQDSIYVACWVATKPPEVPSLENNEALLNRLISTARRVRATEAARAKAKTEFARIKDALATGKALTEAAGDLEFTDVDAFSRYQPPQGLPSSRDVTEAARKAPPETLLEPITTLDGAVLVYLVSRTLPAEEKFAQEKDRYEMQLQWMKRRTVVDRFYQRLEEESDTRLTEAWAPRKEA